MKISKINYIFILLYLFFLSSVFAGDNNDIIMEADYILSCQFANDSSKKWYGAINNIYGSPTWVPTWVVPGENAIAIMGLEKASRILKDDKYLQKANLAADYLVRVQETDGAWCNHYDYEKTSDPEHISDLGKGLRHTAEVIIAFDKLGYNPNRYDSMQKASQFIMECQDVSNKGGNDDGLVGGGKQADGEYHTWRWTSDNSFAYQALNSAAAWAERHKDVTLAAELKKSSQKILDGIQNNLFEGTDHWHRVIDKDGKPIEIDDYEDNPENRSDWIGYSPLMLDLPVAQYGVDTQLVGDWIKDTLQCNDGSLIWDDSIYSDRKSPGYSFQAMLVWLDLNQSANFDDALKWAENSGLWQTVPDLHDITGGWIDWIEGEEGEEATAPIYDRFIDTSAYYIMTHGSDSVERGYNFNHEVPEPSTLIIFLLSFFGVIKFNKNKK